MAPEKTNRKHFGPIDLDGPAMERDNAVREKNDAPKADETVWLKNFLDQSADFSKAEVEFFAELKKRAADAI